MPDATLSNQAFSQLMARIQQSESNAAGNKRQESIDPEDRFHQLIEEIFVKGNSDKLNWHWRTKRFAEIRLPVNDESFEAKLIYFKRGMKVPRHTHRDKEITLVLKGAFSDNTGLYQKGDYVCRTQEHEHSPIAESDCICLAITTEPLKFTGTFGPVLNWFLG
jgi:putative transcriptional regulator